MGKELTERQIDVIVGLLNLVFEWLRKRLILMRELLSDDGSIYVHLDEKKSHYVKVLMDEIFDERNFQKRNCMRNRLDFWIQITGF